MYSVILATHIILAVFITILVLLQKGEGGLGGLGGSNSASNFLTSRQTATALSKFTKYAFAAFVCTSLTLVCLSKQNTIVENVSLIPDVTSENPLPENPLQK